MLILLHILQKVPLKVILTNICLSNSMGEKGAKLNQCYKKHIIFSNRNKAKYHHHHTTTQQKTKPMNNYLFYKIRKIAINIVMWILLLSLSFYIFYRYVCGVNPNSSPVLTPPHQLTSSPPPHQLTSANTTTPAHQLTTTTPAHQC